jgi:hypothetical protein
MLDIKGKLLLLDNVNNSKYLGMLSNSRVDITLSKIYPLKII